MTIPIRCSACGCCSRRTATPCAASKAVIRPCARCATSAPTWCCSTSACPACPASRSPTPCASAMAARNPCWSRSLAAMPAPIAGSRAAWALTTTSPNPTTPTRYSRCSPASDQLRNDREILCRMPGGGGFLERGLGVFQAGEVDLHHLGELERIAKVLQRVLGGERLLGEFHRQHRLHAVVAQREAVGGALGQRVELLRRIEAELADHGERLGDGEHVLEQHHVVDELHRLPGARRAAARDLVRKAIQIRLHPRQVAFPAADNHRERALLRRGPRARHRRIHEADAPGGEPALERSRQTP